MPHTLVGVGVLAMLAITQPSALFYAAFMAGSLAIAIPFAVITSMPSVGRAMIRLHLARLPEEVSPPEILRHLGLAAIELSSAKGNNPRDGSKLG